MNEQNRVIAVCNITIMRDAKRCKTKWLAAKPADVREGFAWCFSIFNDVLFF
jgi:hypothetical protein